MAYANLHVYAEVGTNRLVYETKENKDGDAHTAILRT